MSGEDRLLPPADPIPARRAILSGGSSYSDSVAARLSHLVRAQYRRLNAGRPISVSVPLPS